MRLVSHVTLTTSTCSTHRICPSFPPVAALIRLSQVRFDAALVEGLTTPTSTFRRQSHGHIPCIVLLALAVGCSHCHLVTKSNSGLGCTIIFPKSTSSHNSTTAPLSAPRWLIHCWNNHHSHSSVRGMGQSASETISIRCWMCKKNIFTYP